MSSSTSSSGLTSATVGGMAFFLTTAIILRLIQKQKQSNRTYVISHLYIYPIKSCKGISLTKAKISATGLLYDRMFVLVDANNRFVTQRKYPKMAKIETSINWDLNQLIVSSSEVESTLTIDLNYPCDYTATEEVTIWGDKCQTIEVVGQHIRDWFQKAIEVEGIRLMRMEKSFIRKTDSKYAPNGQTGFSDGYPFLLASEASLEELNKHLATPITMARFRPNIVLTNTKPFEEDLWKQLKVFSTKSSLEVVSMNVVKPCARCTVPNVDPVSAIMDESHGVTKALQTFRTGEKAQFDNPKWRKEVFFGQNVDHEGKSGGEISTGDCVKVIH